MAEVSLHHTQIGPRVDQNLDELLNQVQSSDNRPRQITAARALGFTTRQSEVIPVLVMLLADQDANLVSSCLVSLWLMANPGTPVTPLVDILNHEDADVRNNDAMALSAILRAKRAAGDGIPDEEVKRASGKLVVIVLDIEEDEFVRAHAASALGAIGDPAAVDVLINLLGDGSSAVRTRAAEGLGQLGDDQAVPALIDALAGRRAPNEKAVIVAALEKIAWDQGWPCDIEALGQEVENWRAWYMTLR
jgi:HEAT repeat protein